MGENKSDAIKAYALLLLANYTLTLREAEVFLWLARGKKNKEIAPLLCMEYKTVRTHRFNIYKKLKVHSEHALTEIARGLGLV